MPDVTQPSPTLTTREVAARLSLSVTTVQAMAERGELEAWRTAGGHRRISVDSVDAWAHARGCGFVRSGEASLEPDSSGCSIRVLYAGGRPDIFSVIEAFASSSSPGLLCHRVGDALDALLWAERLRPNVLIIEADLAPIGPGALLGRLRRYPQFAQMLSVILCLDDGFQVDLASERLAGCVRLSGPGAADRVSGLLEGVMAAVRH
jgi:excisionase family DNA binding protein